MILNNKDISTLKELIYHTKKDDLINRISKIDNPLILHNFAANFDWNNDFDVPKAILVNESCDLGTGLLIFQYADGYRLLESPVEVSASPFKEWKDFLFEVNDKLINLEFKSKDISFNPELTKTQIYKLKKNNPNIPEILISISPGNVVAIPKI